MKSFSWSYSRLKNYETCPKRYYEVDVLKNVQDDTTQLRWGNKVHDAFKVSLSSRAPMQREFQAYQKWANTLTKRFAAPELLVEQKFALTRQLTPCEWFSPTAWFRAIGDVVGLAAPWAMILDWKTGKPQVDSKQLMLLAACVFAFHPDIDHVDSGFVWLKDDTQTIEQYHRSSINEEWLGVLPRVERMEAATAASDFPAQPNKLCRRYCPVIDCPHNGRRSQESD